MPVADIYQERSVIIRVAFALIAILLVYWLLRLQVLDTPFRDKAEAAGVSRQTEYPARGLFYDRNGELLVVNAPMYDLLVTYNQFEKNKDKFDTLKFCRLLGITPEYFNENMTKNWRSGRFAKSVPFVFLSKITPAQYAAFQESIYEFPGFAVQLRNARGYPHPQAPHLLGYIGEVDQKILEDSASIYDPGDYIGASGLEKFYEYFLRGDKGVTHILKDNLGRSIGQLDEGKRDKPPTSGLDLLTTIDLELQAYGEKLMANKAGSIVAIEPSTGEILAMISTPGYDPRLLVVGQQRGQAYAALATDSLLPLLNRSVIAQYPPGSLFKPLVALIGLQEGVITAERGVACGGAYYLGGQRLTGCHAHPYCGNVETAIQYSCNAYFVTVFRDIVDQFNEKTPRRGLNTFNDYLQRFGMGSPLGVDIPSELAGNYPTSEDYDRKFRNETGWKSVWIRSLGIGQGELLMTNLQMANLAATIANRGYYITPHLVRAMRNQDNQVVKAPLALDIHKTGIDARHFEPIINGMEKVVIAGTARNAFIWDIPVCGKTGTAENNQGSGEDHSIFFAFAPKENPKIAIAVYIENGGWGGSYAAPIASLMIEKYIKRKIAPEREYLEKRMLDANLLLKNRRP